MELGPFRLNNGGARAAVLARGAALQVYQPAGMTRSIVLGPGLDDMENPAYLGTLVGRVANRIGQGRAVLGGQVLALHRNEGQHMLHGGGGQVLWDLADHSASHVVLARRFDHLEMGFPGALDVQARYALDEAGRLSLEVTAQTDRPTLCNFALHSYFNLTGAQTLEGHLLQIPADQMVEVDGDGIPTGALMPAEYRDLRPIDPALDHNFCLADRRRAVGPMARLQAEGVALDIHSTAPGLQVYAGRHLPPPLCGVALEPQDWPDAPNHQGFPDITLQPSERYYYRVEYHLQRRVI